MTLYMRIGNQTVTEAQAKNLTPTDIEKIKQDAAQAEQKRQDNLAASMGLNTKAVSKNIVADIRPGSELAKAIVEDKLALVKQEAELVGKINQETSPTTSKKKRGRPSKKVIGEAVQV